MSVVYMCGSVGLCMIVVGLVIVMFLCVSSLCGR